MGLLIILIVVGVIWYKHQEKDNEESQKDMPNGQETFEEFKKSAEKAKKNDNFYINEVPYGVRRKTAMDTFLQSDRSNVKVDFSNNHLSSIKESRSNENDREITDEDLLVNESTGEITTPEMTFNSKENDIENENVSDSEKIIPIVEDKSNSANSKRHISTPNVGDYQPKKEKNTQHYREDWKAKNYKSFDDLLNSSNDEVR